MPQGLWLNGKTGLATLEGGIEDDDPGYMVVARGNGDGTFQSPLTYDTASTGYPIAVGDFNGEGKPDIVIGLNSNFPTNGILAVYLGNGDGTFQPPATTFPTLIFPYGIAVGDLNGDGKADVVITEQYAYTGCPAISSVAVFLGNGDGSFQPAANYDVTTFPNSVAIGDFNGDGKPDLAFSTNSAFVGAMLGNGDGTFQSPVYYSTAYQGGLSDPFDVIVAFQCRWKGGHRRRRRIPEQPGGYSARRSLWTLFNFTFFISESFELWPEHNHDCKRYTCRSLGDHNLLQRRLHPGYSAAGRWNCDDRDAVPCRGQEFTHGKLQR